MSALMTLSELQEGVKALSRDEVLIDPFSMIEDAVDLLSPPESISTLECAEKYRVMPGAEDGAVVRYDRWRTPYNIGPTEALDREDCNLLVMVKPSRSGGTAVLENYLFKRIKFGPMTWVSWVLNSDEAVTAYCRNVVKPMFEHNDDLQQRVGTARGNDTDKAKTIRGYPVEWLSAKDSTFRNRQPGLMVLDESDGYGPKFNASPRVQIDGRQKLLGNRKKAAILSHADLGWKAGVASEFEDTSRGIFVMQCCHCLMHAAAYATKFWPGVPQFKFDWQRDPEAPNDKRLELAQETAAIYCPHCGSEINDEERRDMIDAAVTGGGNSQSGWMHRGQSLDPEAGVVGEMTPTTDWGYWIHGTMLKTESLGDLARDYQGALIKVERTRDARKLKEFLSKQLGEVYEGAATTANLSAEKIHRRANEQAGPTGYQRGIAPRGVRFVTAAVDTGARKFDVAWHGWDLDGRSWLLDRITIRQRRHDDGVLRDIHLSRNQDDWWVLMDDVLERRFPMEDDPDMEFQVACMTVDSGDGNVTWKAREFARRAYDAGAYWGKAKWSKIKLIKGDDGKKPAIPDAPRAVTKDEEGRKVQPIIYEYTLGADALKSMTLECLAIEDDAPGQCYFYDGFEYRFAEEYFGEAEMDGKWVRSGPNEMLDLHGYSEAARAILKPDRATIKWAEGKLPPWAKPVPLKPKGGDPVRQGEQENEAASKPKVSRVESFINMTQRT